MDRQRNGKTDIKTEKNAKTERNTEVEIDFGETEKWHSEKRVWKWRDRQTKRWTGIRNVNTEIYSE